MWKAIPGFEGYEVSDQGQVRSYRRLGGGQFHLTPHLLRPAVDQQGYRGVNLRRNGQTYFKKVASLVLLAFIGQRPNGMHGCHNNSNPNDDRLENLRYDTPCGNARDRLSLSNAQVIEMRERRGQGRAVGAIAQSFGVSYGIAKGICRGNYYMGVGGIFTTDGRSGPLSIDDIITMRTERANTNITLKMLGKKYGISESSVSRICRGERYPNDGGPITIGKSVPRTSKRQDDVD